MIIKAFLIISSGGSVRVVKNRPYINNDEIAVNLNIDVPDIFFERLIPTVTITLPPEAIIDMDAETVVKEIAPRVAESLKLEVEGVEDGPLDMVNSKEGGAENE